MDVKKTLKTAETVAVIGGAAILSAAIWWPLGIPIVGYWYYKRRFRKNQKTQNHPRG